MKEVADLLVTRFYLFAPGKIPFKHLSTKRGIHRIEETFDFREVGSTPGTTELLFESGSVKLGETETTIVRTNVSDRRITVVVAGTSEKASKAYDLLRQVIQQSEPALEFDSQPVSVREETSCTVTLAVSWDQFFSSKLVRFVTGPFVEAASDSEADVSLATVNLRFGFSYTIKNRAMSEYGIRLANKTLTVEPLADTPLAERRYYTASPTDSDTHLKIVEQLENVLLT